MLLHGGVCMLLRAGVWLANAEGLKGNAVPGSGWVVGGGGSALGPLVGSRRAGARLDMVCRLSLMLKFAPFVLLECADAIQVVSGSWSGHRNVTH